MAGRDTAKLESRPLKLSLLALVGVGLLLPAGAAWPSPNRSSVKPLRNPTVLAGCAGVGKPRVRPEEIVLACGDGNQAIENLKWTGWGWVFAAGRGTAVINDCTPSCVAGRDHSYPVVVILTGRQTCRPGGQIAYLKLTAAYIDGKPHTSFSQTFLCRPDK